jgi:hypothetical protein
MAVNAETIRQLGKAILSCILLSLCSSVSRTWEEKSILFPGSQSENISNSDRKDITSSDVTSTIRWASVIILLSAIYYIQIQIWKKIWQRKQERGQRALRRNQYRQTRTGQVQALGRHHGEAAHFSVDEEDVDLDSLPTISENEDVTETISVVSNDVYYPELTMSSVWTFVYGYGILLFVSTYCLAGINIPSSCWWVMGMIALSFDELISTRMNRWYICIILLNICVSVFTVWSAALIDNEGNFIGELMFSKTSSVPLFDFIMGVVFPVSTPFIFFSFRSSMRSSTRDTYKLCEFALPFMTVLAICILVATSGFCHVVDSKSGTGSVQYVGSISQSFKPFNAHQDTHTRRSLTGSTSDGNKRKNQHIPMHHLTQNNNDNNVSSASHIETSATFTLEHPITLSVQYFKFSTDNNVARYTLLFLSPFIAFWAIHVLITSIHTGHSAEFITAFILVNSTRYGITHPASLWSALSISGAGIAFSVLLVGRRD